ncbi:MAG: cytochrome C [Planctomycetes bacterium]|nr:cytochrome C [Planctomycetota bacterium]
MKPSLTQSLIIGALASGSILFITISCSDVQASNSPIQSTHSGGTAAEVASDTAEGCLSCHQGIESIREDGSNMGLAIAAMGNMYGDPAGCVVCHGGNPQATTAEDAHSGVPENMAPNGPQAFYPDPGSIHVADFACGQCHPGYVYRLERSLMNTEAGKIQGNLHTWGIDEVTHQKVPWGNYDVEDTDGAEPSIGTPEYKEYMLAMKAAHPNQFPDSLTQVPLPSVEEIEADPKLAGFTYQRQQCQRCHVGVKGREKRGDYRGMGCSSCHMLYSNEGFYEGDDPTIDKEERGHMLTHRMHGTRRAGNGIPVETCNSCHNRGKRIGVTYQGLMEFPYGSPYDEAGHKQPKLHTKKYLFISDDLHHQIDSRPGNPQGGMLCQDCHTTIDMHGDGNIFGTTLAQVEIECQDCHGTPDAFPWELPLGYSEEFGRELDMSAQRGLAELALPETRGFATLYPAEDGYILSARGNPLGNVVKKDDKVILHSATGNDFEVPVLKTIATNDTWKSEDAKVAMSSVGKHAEELECYACHASWVPQCYGCHVQVNYGKDANGEAYSDVDWISSASIVHENGQTAESKLGVGGIKEPGKVFETRSYLRWEEPVLGVNGEGRVTPLMPGCQVVFTVIGRDGETKTLNEIAYAPDEAENIGQDHVPLAIDMAPVQPHSAQRKARTCESCHNNPKAQGYGISGGVFQTRYTEDIIEDLMDQRTGKPLAKRSVVQIQKIPALNFDWSTIIDKDGNQVQTVGTHWPLSRALSAEQRDGMNRVGLCMGCHQHMSNTELWGKVATEGTMSDEEHIELMNEMFKAYAEKKENSKK